MSSQKFLYKSSSEDDYGGGMLGSDSDIESSDQEIGMLGLRDDSDDSDSESDKEIIQEKQPEITDSEKLIDMSIFVNVDIGDSTSHAERGWFDRTSKSIPLLSNCFSTRADSQTEINFSKLTDEEFIACKLFILKEQFSIDDQLFYTLTQNM